MFSDIKFEDNLEKAVREYLERAKYKSQSLPEKIAKNSLKDAVKACLDCLRDKRDNRQ
jgi:hypothetical protein